MIFGVAMSYLLFLVCGPQSLYWLVGVGGLEASVNEALDAGWSVCGVDRFYGEVSETWDGVRSSYGNAQWEGVCPSPVQPV